MKKIITLLMVAGLTACASQNTPEYQYERYDCGQPVVYETRQIRVQEAPAPQMYEAYNPCRCAYRPDPCRPILRPRVKETVFEKPRRRCPPDNQMLNCGCGYCQTFKQPVVYRQVNEVSAPAVVENVQYRRENYVPANYVPASEIIPNQRDAYLLASGRVLNNFLKDTANIYSKNPNVRLYVKTARAGSEDLPGGINEGPDSMREQIASSYTFAVSDTLADADYYLETEIDWLDTPSKTVPAIQYKVSLYDNENNKIDEWVEVVKKADNSDNWL